MGGIFIAFKNYNFQKGFWGSDWVGFENFRYLFLTPDAFRITRNTILYNLLFIIINTAVAVALAILISEVVSRKLQKLYQTSIFLPFLVSMVIVSYIGYSLLSTDTGFVNNSILAPLGKDPISFYNRTTYWPLILAFVNCWKSVGYSCVIYLSAILGIDREMYEAADLDGAGKMKQIHHITLPNLKSTIIMLTLMSVGRMFYSDFGLFYQVPLNSSAIRNVTDTIDTYAFREYGYDL